MSGAAVRGELLLELRDGRPVHELARVHQLCDGCQQRLAHGTCHRLEIDERHELLRGVGHVGGVDRHEPAPSEATHSSPELCPLRPWGGGGECD